MTQTTVNPMSNPLNDRDLERISGGNADNKAQYSLYRCGSCGAERYRLFSKLDAVMCPVCGLRKLKAVKE